jgi:hypothetical protein
MKFKLPLTDLILSSEADWSRESVELISIFQAMIRHYIDKAADLMTSARSTPAMVACAVIMATTYVLSTFDLAFLFGIGPFWANPIGPWLMDPADTIISGDLLDVLVGYRAFLHSGWHMPLFFVRDLGPSGTNVLLLGAIPLVALLGKIISILAGTPVNPYGAWVAACFILSAIFATLVVIETGQRSLLAAGAASLLAISAPPLLHRFGHLTYMAHFIAIGTLFLYLRDPRVKGTWTRSLSWIGWLCLAFSLDLYLFTMCSVLYGASWLRRLHVERPTFLGAVAEPVTAIAALSCVATLVGFGIGDDVSPFAFGFGYFSMNLASPFWPQRSGLFPGFDPIVDATGGQYEGFNYFGFGALLLIVIAIIMNRRSLGTIIVEHRYLLVGLIGLFAFALSDRVFLGNIKLLDLAYSWRVDHYLGVFRSSGRMFWPIFYAVMLFGLVGVLRQISPRSGVVVVLGCCLLQLIDTNPLRARLTRLTERAVPELINRAEWEARISRAANVQLEPPFQCLDPAGSGTPSLPHLELQLVAATIGRPINSVYFARSQMTPESCAAASAKARNGPWRDDTLYVFLTGGSKGVPADWKPPRQSCETFPRGWWCLGPFEPAR